MPRKNNLLLLLLFAFLYPSAVNAEERFGKYEDTPIQVQFCADGRHVRLLKTLIYMDPSGARWEAPTGSIVDGASIPQWAWSIIGGPFEGKYRDASIIHDVACDSQTRPWEYVHLAFYYAMLASGVDETKAKIMYAAVYHYGPRWEVHGSEWRPPVKSVGDMQCEAVPEDFTSDPRDRMRMRADIAPPAETAPGTRPPKTNKHKHKAKTGHKRERGPAQNMAETDRPEEEMPPEFEKLKRSIEAQPEKYDIDRLQKEADRLP